MHRIFSGFVLLGCLALACGKSETVTTRTVSTSSSSGTVGGTPPVAAASSAIDPAMPMTSEPSLVSFSSGALIARKPQEYGEGWSAFWLLDEKADTGWATPKNVVTPQQIVIALPEKTTLTRLEFDTASTDGENRGAKDVLVELSDESADAGYQKIAEVTLEKQMDRQTFPAGSDIAGRWVRLNIRNNHGATDFTELMDFRGYGRQETQTPFRDASGSYETDYGKFHIKQEGTSVTGCYERSEGLISGGIEGRVMKLTWAEKSGGGPAIMVFDPTGEQMFGLWWSRENLAASAGVWNGRKVSSTVGTCPHWAGTGAEALMKKELEELGRTRVYGINFDTGSDVIREESKPTLDKIVAVMTSVPDWKLTIEGHTDSSGSEAQNQELSQRRADAVKTYLVQANVSAARLTARGFGASKTVAGNDTPSGRAQNRRVELTRG